MPPLEFTINLGGNLVSSLKGANTALVGTEKHLHDTGDEAKLFESEIGKLSESAGGLSLNLSALSKGGAGLFTFDLAEGAEAVGEAFKKVYEIAEAVVEKVVDLGKEFIKTAAESSDLELSVDLVFGDQAEAIKTIGNQFESRSRFQGEEIEKMLLPLGQAGIRDTELLGRIATAATDMATRGGGGIGAAQEAVEAFKKIQLRGEVNPKILEKVFGSEQAFYADLGQQLGVSSKRAEQMMKAHQIGNRQLLDTVLHQISVGQGTPGLLGTATEKGAKTLGGTLERLKNLPGNFMRAIAEGSGGDRLAGFLDRLLVQLDPNGPTGVKIVAAMETITSKIMGVFEGLDVGGLVDSLVDGAMAIGGAFNEAWPFVKMFGSALADLAREAKVAWEWMGKIGSAIDSVGGFVLKVSGGAVGGSALEGLGARRAELEGRAAASRASIARILADPDVPLEQKQEAMAAGRKLLQSDVPHMAEGGVVRTPTVALIGEAGPEAVVPLDRLVGAGGASVSIGDIHVHVTSTGGDVREAGLDAARIVRYEVKKLLDEAGFGLGAGLSGV